MFETLTILRENLTFLPRQQVDQRNCNSITGNQGIPDKKKSSLIFVQHSQVTDDTDVIVDVEEEELTKLTVS